MPETTVKTDLCSLTVRELESYFSSLGEPKYRAKQFFSAIARGKRFSEITTFPLSLRARLEETAEYRIPEIVQKQVSALDGTTKYLMRMTDGEEVESVLMLYEHGTTLCVSSQVGCRMGCRFCASTIGGRIRDLLPSEIYGQAIAAGRDAGRRIDGIVMMGIGEPLDNLENVLKFLALVGEPEGLCIGYRHISLSTCGLADKIEELKRADLPITLSISLHASDDARRSAVMPVNDRYPLDVLLSACRDYFSATGRRISFEYTMLRGENDSEEDARRLARLLRRYFPEGTPVHINLIRLNPVRERDYRSPDDAAAKAFCEALCRLGMNATLRRRLGPDIDAACGQLRRSRIKDAGSPHTTERTVR